MLHGDGMIKDYHKRKLVEYLEPGKKFLIRFPHGWGDTQLFMPLLEEMRRRYPESQIDVCLSSGQEGWFGAIVNPQEGTYAEVFEVNFPLSESSSLTKPERCAIEELGIPFIPEGCPLPVLPSPFVGVHFQGTSCAESTNCPVDVAQHVWNEIAAFGKIPIETHFIHVFANPVNQALPFVTRDVRDLPIPGITLRNLVGLIQRCWAFVGVTSGPLITALYTLPGRVLVLERVHKLSDYTHQCVSAVDVMKYKPGTIRAWLESLHHSELVP